MNCAIEEVVERYRENGFELPETWKGRMEEVANGAIDFDDAVEMIAVCVDIADRASGDRGEDCDLVSVWETLLCGEPHTVMVRLSQEADSNGQMARRLIQCGRVADAVCALTDIVIGTDFDLLSDNLRRQFFVVSNWIHLSDMPDAGE